jgi:hypothetical protein
VPSSVTAKNSESLKAPAISCKFVVRARILLNRKNTAMSTSVIKTELHAR